MITASNYNKSCILQWNEPAKCIIHLAEVSKIGVGSLRLNRNYKIRYVKQVEIETVLGALGRCLSIVISLDVATRIFLFVIVQSQRKSERIAIPCITFVVDKQCYTRLFKMLCNCIGYCEQTCCL